MLCEMNQFFIKMKRNYVLPYMMDVFLRRVSCLVIIKKIECIDRILQNIWGHNC